MFVRQGGKSLPRANTLASYENPLRTKKVLLHFAVGTMKKQKQRMLWQKGANLCGVGDNSHHIKQEMLGNTRELLLKGKAQYSSPP